jgi:drug/metabolite transporter (DMT)-like permease
VSLLLGLLTSLLWGSADYGGGLLSRRLPVATVVFVSQAVALFAVGGLLAVSVANGGGPLPVGGYLVFGAAAGVLGSAALVAFYRALAAGPMGLVAPVAATGVAVPVVAGLVRGERLTAFQDAGVVLAVAGAVLASGPEMRSDVPVRRQTVLLSVAAALGFGAVRPLLAEGARTSIRPRYSRVCRHTVTMWRRTVDHVSEMAMVW